MIGFTCGEGIKNENCDNATLYIDIEYIKGWGIDEDGCLYIEATMEAMDQIGDCAKTIAMDAMEG